MFCKIKIIRYFVTFIIDNNIAMIFNMSWILASNWLLRQIQLCVKLMTSFSWWCNINMIDTVLVEVYYQFCAVTMTTVLVTQSCWFMFLAGYKKLERIGKIICHIYRFLHLWCGLKLDCEWNCVWESRHCILGFHFGDKLLVKLECVAHIVANIEQNLERHIV